MTGRDIDIEGKDGRFSAYLAAPETENAPGILVIQEIFGVNEAMRTICDDVAAQGYYAICPDLFWRQEPGIQISDKTEAEWQKAFELYKGFDLDKGIADLASTISYLRNMEATNGKIGTVGYCLGGLLAYLTACRADPDAAVGYYGVGIHEHLDEARHIKAPVLLHVACEDEFVDKDAQRKMHEGLDDHALVTLYDYEGANHAFARPDGQHFNRAAAESANQRTADFFARHLLGR